MLCPTLNRRFGPIPDIAATTSDTEAFRLTSSFALSEEWCAGLHPQHDPTTSFEVAALHPNMLYGREHVAKAPLQRATFIDRCSTADVIGYLHDCLSGLSDLRAG
jgi:hypothetical protein